MFLWVIALSGVAAVFAIQRIESRPKPVSAPFVTQAFSPNGDGHIDSAKIHFTIPKRQAISVTVIDADGDSVRAITDHETSRVRQRYTWDGAGKDGKAVDDGTYRVKIELHTSGDEVTLPTKIVVDRKPPRLRNVEFGLQNATQLRVTAQVSGGTTLVFRLTNPNEIIEPKNLQGGDALTGAGRFHEVTVVAPLTEKLIRTLDVGDHVGTRRIALVVTDSAGNRDEYFLTTQARLPVPTARNS